jgi:hypothetical protein
MAAPRDAVKGSDIVPDWKRFKDSIPLSGEEDSPAKGINFNSASGAPSKQFPCHDSSTPARE